METITLVIICVIGFILIGVGAIIMGVAEGEKIRDMNEKEIGLSITREERLCYEHCSPSKYLYISSTSRKQMLCECN